MSSDTHHSTHRRPFAAARSRRARSWLFALACLAIGALVACIIVPQRFSNAATVAQVDCSTDPAVFNTGYSTAARGIGATGSNDERWTAAGGYDGFNHVSDFPQNSPVGPLPPSLPPTGAVFGPAYLGKINDAWIDSPFRNAQWIAQSKVMGTPGQNQSFGWADFYFKYEFDLSPAVDPASFRLDVDWYADNNVRGIWVNNALKASNPTYPYRGDGFSTGKQLSTSLTGFASGRNTILVQVGSGYSAIGFLAQVKSTSLCPSLTVAKTVDGRVDASDQFVVAAREVDGNPTTSVTTSGTQTTSTSARAFVVPGEKYTITDTMAAGSKSPATLYRGTLVCTGAKGGATLPVSGTWPTWTVTIPAIDDYTCTVTNSSHTFSVSKTASTQTAHPGESVSYTVTVTNTGRSAFTATDPASFTDDLSALLDDATYNGDATNGAVVSGNTLSWSGPLSVGGTATVTYSFTVNQPRTGDGRLTNSVTGGPNCYSACAAVVGTDVRAYTVSKKASTTIVALGGKVTYTVTVTNTGPTDYTADEPITLTDDLSDVLDDATYNGDATKGAVVSGKTLSWSGALDAGKTTTITYSVTVNAPASGDRQLTNAVLPTAPGGVCVDADSCKTVTQVSDPSISLTKSADKSHLSIPAKAGDTITYTFEATNTGNVTLTDVVVTDPLPGLSTITPVWPDPTAPGTLLPGESVTATATYQVTQENIDAGHVMNTAAATGMPPSGPVIDSPPATVDTPLTVAATLSLDKVIDSTTMPSPAKVGDVITFRFRVTNTGNVTVTDTVIRDRMPGLSEMAYVWPGLSGQLAPGEAMTATATYALTDADMAAGHVANSATAAATEPGGARKEAPPASVDTPLSLAQLPAVAG